MKYILRKFVDAATVAEALAKDSRTPVHDCYLKEGEHPPECGGMVSPIGFAAPLQQPLSDEWVSPIGFAAPLQQPLSDECWGEPLAARKKV
jgi:hypothetical protein